jgi:MscS family membrane protein
VIFVIVSIAEIFNLPLSSLLAGLGIGGIAIAMAAKDTIANIFGSLTVLVDRPFHIGDWVVIDDTEGTVEDVGFRSTRVRTFYDSVITIPNSLLLTAKVDNMGSRTYRRIRENLSITYQTAADDVDAFCDAIRQIISEHQHTRKDYFLVNFTGFKDSHLEIMLYCFVKVPNWQAELDAKQDILLKIARKAEEMGIEFAYPTQTLFIKKDD